MGQTADKLPSLSLSRLRQSAQCRHRPRSIGRRELFLFSARDRSKRSQPLASALTASVVESQRTIGQPAPPRPAAIYRSIVGDGRVDAAPSTSTVLRSFDKLLGMVLLSRRRIGQWRRSREGWDINSPEFQTPPVGAWTESSIGGPACPAGSVWRSLTL